MIFFRLFFIWCFICTVYSQIVSTVKCPPNEEPAPCMSRCDRCEDRKGGCFQTEDCKPGCNCRKGFYRNNQGICIPEKQCDKTCAPNSQPSNCASWCPPTCSNRNPACAEVCVVGCVCDPGFIKDDYGNCIPENQCPNTKTCAPNSQPSNCASWCPPTCSNRNPACAAVCVDGCVCDPGFIKDDYGNCIPENQCPNTKTCGQNSQPSNCASWCPPTCSNRNPQCAAVCVVGCVCDPGFISDDKGNCIPENQCPNTMICGPNSRPSNCASWCPPTCSKRNPICLAICIVGCVCEPGYIKNDYGICIPIHQCNITECPKFKCKSGCRLDTKNKPCPRCVCLNGLKNFPNKSKENEAFYVSETSFSSSQGKYF